MRGVCEACVKCACVCVRYACFCEVCLCEGAPSSHPTCNETLCVCLCLCVCGVRARDNVQHRILQFEVLPGYKRGCVCACVCVL